MPKYDDDHRPPIGRRFGVERGCDWEANVFAGMVGTVRAYSAGFGVYATFPEFSQSHRIPYEQCNWNVSQ